ncbi:MFS transporter [Burkholderia gladioli]|uniref:MFS transporter n=1 Tax=Burkholderia gladioli TaxID=28095 RepID=A0A2A7SGM1_BURGA|nr:MFS transporter [Burkholderia gladioli]MBU9426953.1 MFS transporter [Burkholderia gladioli]MDN8061016.1 MFS transporter [Burkholderia gladioli]PEH42668.1 MFS transporter [Burkholderia gladioli]QPQ86751.1 MFS transporter [Burkholderia gladioli]
MAATHDTQPALPPDLMKRIAWRIGPLMVLMYVANQLDRANVGYAALTMNAELGMSAAQYGLSASLFFLGYILCEVPSNLFMHRYGARRWMTRILLSWGLLSSLTSFVPNAHWLYAARFLLGAFEAGLYPGMVYYLTLWMPARNRVWMMSLFTMSIPLTGMLGAPVSTWIMEHASVFGITGWRAMILLEGVPAMLLGVVAWFWLPDGPHAWRGLGEADHARLRTALAAEQESAAAAVQPDSARKALGNPKVWALGLVYFGINSGIIGLLYFLPQVVKTFSGSAHLSLTRIGLISAVPFAVAVVGVLAWGRLVSRRRVHAGHVAGPLMLSAVTLASALYLVSPLATVAVLAVGTTACFCSISTFWQLPTRILTDRAAAAGIALITSIGVSSGFLMPYFIGWVRDTTGTFRLAFIAIAVAMTIGSALAIVLDRPKQRAFEASMALK